MLPIPGSNIPQLIFGKPNKDWSPGDEEAQDPFKDMLFRHHVLRWSSLDAPAGVVSLAPLNEEHLKAHLDLFLYRFVVFGQCRVKFGG